MIRIVALLSFAVAVGTFAGCNSSTPAKKAETKMEGKDGKMEGKMDGKDGKMEGKMDGKMEGKK
ncbi:MAG: hypothetical protein WCL32_24080 [Planctomycetota bacterium]